MSRGWRSTSEPPEEGKIVLVAYTVDWCEEPTALVAEGSLEPSGWCLGRESIPMCREQSVYAWRPLPRPPRPERFR